MAVIVQKLRAVDGEKFDNAKRYYSILSALWGLALTETQINLLAFTCVRGTITPLSARNEFVTRFNSSLPSIENIKGKLTKKGLLIKVDGKYRVHPRLEMDFSKDVIMQIPLKYKNGDSK